MKARFLLALAFTAVAGFAAIPYSGDDSDRGITQTTGLVDTYTGNLAFATRDLIVSGAVGRYGLSWQRHTTSRSSQAGNFFGLGHNWTHSWQWEMAEAGTDSQGRAVITVREPQGHVHRFTATGAGQWQGAPSERDRLVSDGNNFTLQRIDAGNVRFIRESTGQGEVFTPLELEDDAGNVWNLSWRNGLLDQITESAGRWLKISYKKLASPGAKAFTVIDRVTASDGQKVAYTYAFPSGADYPVLTGATYSDATSSSYVYEAPRPGDRLLLTQVDDPNADRVVRGVTFHYRAEAEAAFGQVSEIRAADGGAVIHALAADTTQPGGRNYVVTLENGSAVYRTYNPGGNLAQEIDALGFVTKTEYDAGGRGFRIATTDALGNVTRFENDATGYAVKTIFPDGSVTSVQRDARGRVLSATDELGQIRRYTHDARGRVIRVQHPDGSTEETTYNAFGQPVTRRDRAGALTTTSYDSRGLRTQSANALGATTGFTYDAQDRLATTTDARGNTTRYERDAVGRVTKTTYADGATTTAAYDRFGQLTGSVDATGIAHRITYDGLGRRVASVDAKGQATKVEYAPMGSIAPISRPVKGISASGRATTMAYDAKGRVTARTSAAGTTESATTRTAYDAAGRQISVTNAAGKTVQFIYDKRGRRIKTMSALNHATTIEYNAAGRKVSETDAKGNTTRWTYDVMGRELTKTDAKGQVTRREYDAAGRLVALTDAKLNTYRFEYDLLGRQTALVYPDGSRETTVYDAAGLKVRFTNRAGTVQTFTYDNRNREIASEWSDGSQRILKAYDAAGRMAIEDNGVSRLTYAYDETGQLASETQDLGPVVTDGTFDPAARSVHYTYNPDGQRETLGYPDGSFVQFAYDGQGRLAAILGNGQEPPIARYEYDAAGNATHMPRENATETEREFDAENKTLAITERTADRRSPLSQLDYLYDEVGNRTATLAATNADDRGVSDETLDTYRYDETYQVTGVDYAAPVQSAHVGSPAGTERFTYDAVGNRIQVDVNGMVTRYAVNNLNQYTQVGQFLPTHDRNGNLSGMGQWLYRYDALNRLVFATNGTMTARFFYDAKNRCVARNYTKIDASTSTSPLALNYYDNWNLIEERDSSGAQQARYVHGRKIDEIVLMSNRYGTFYPHHDVLGNVTMLTGKDGRLAERYVYSVTGQVSVFDMAGKPLAESAVGNRWMFTGREWLPEVGLYDYRNRVYSAELGRFLQTDTIRFSARDINLYRYAKTNYLNLIDPSGEDWQELADSIGNYIFTGAGAAAGAYLGGSFGAGVGFVVTGGTTRSFAGAVVGFIAGGAVGSFTGGYLANEAADALWIKLDPFGVHEDVPPPLDLPDPETLPKFDYEYDSTELLDLLNISQPPDFEPTFE